ncbi:hypothetical protein AX16_004743 [Volvariella volvacea WC 439]|nr:hypothetical protein AX16_004743 [Volvariella volvacea WC 439]
MASQYWNKPDTADCTIIVPLPNQQARPSASSITRGDTPGLTSSARRATEPGYYVPQISMDLHMDYLCAHSSLLRGLFGGTSPIDLLNVNAGNIFSPTPRSRSSPFANRFPRLLSSDPDHPVLYLPVPNPASLHLLFHWMYFGDTVQIEEHLRSGAVHWEGIVRNVEYLGLSQEIKGFLSRWYSRWVLREDCDAASDDEEDSDTMYSDSSFDSEEEDGIATPSDSLSLQGDELVRGRDRTIRPLSIGSNPKRT